MSVRAILGIFIGGSLGGLAFLVQYAAANHP